MTHRPVRRAGLFLAALLALGGPAFATPPDGYYAAAQGLTGPQLRAALHATIANHQTVSYDSLWAAYEKTDVTTEGRPWCIYSGYPFATFQRNPGGIPGKIGNFLTREHSFPKDWWGGTKNPAFSDLFHVIVGDAHVNGQKGVKPLGETNGNARTFGISRVGPARAGLGYVGEVFEPADEFKGDFARNYLYVATRYLEGNGHLDCTRSPMIGPDGVTFKPWAINLLKKWNREDPVSERELRRNDAVFQIQKNRNPFIDHPEFADLIWPAPTDRGLLLGADVDYAPDMEQRGKTWRNPEGKPEDVYALLRHAGLDSLRVRVWTGDEGMNGLIYATNVLRRAQRNGLRPFVTLFLSENWADYVKQPVPAIWKDLSFDAKVGAVRAYAERVARHFADHGITVDYYEIGNEIDFGICGEFESEWNRRVNVDAMKAKIWPRMAAIIRAAQEGVRRVRPEAKFTLHLTQWWNPSYCGEFFKAMLAAKVRVDFAGLSYFPTSDLSKETSLDAFIRCTRTLSETVRRPVIICEYGFPAAPRFPGQFATWNQPVAGYALDPSGQARWLRDFLGRIESAGFIDGAFYWSPEWYDSGLWSAFALFDADGAPRPALGSFR